MRLTFILAIIAVFTGLNTVVIAGEADVEEVRAEKTGEGTYRFSVTVRHADAGWDHYANKWDISGPDGTIFGTRILHHPHENEQPFTRSLGAVEIPQGVKSVIVRAYDSVHADGGREMNVELPD